MAAVNLEEFGERVGRILVMVFVFWMGYLIVNKVFKKKDGKKK